MTYEECQQPDKPSRTEFLGPFVFDSSDQPGWVLGRVALMRVGNQPSSDLGVSGTLDVAEYDPATGRVALTLEVEFSRSGIVQGTVVVPSPP
jgi:hypothetical protein